MAWCLVPQLAEQFKQELVSGAINPQDLATMSSADRRKFFTSRFGEENAKNINTLFESKLLLKNQQAGMISWAKRVMGMDKVAQRDIISRVEKMDKILSPKEEKAFLEDIAAKRLGVGITFEEAQKIAELSKRAQSFSDKHDRNYGRAVVALNNYVNDLKIKADKIKLSDLKTQPAKTALKAVSRTAGAAKSLKASLDLSYTFRPGLKVLIDSPKIWADDTVKAFSDAVKSFGNKPVIDELNADLITRKNAVNGNYKKAGLAVGTTEEAYPSSLPEKIPILGRAFKASQNAYTSFVHRARADIFDKVLEIRQNSGKNIDEKALQSIGKFANSLTGRGSLGRAELVANDVNNIFFSPRMVKSNIDFLTMHALDKTSGFIKKRAAFNLLKAIAGAGAIYAIAHKISPGSVEPDLRSSDAFKVKVGNTRFDYTAGMGSIAILLARQITGSTKSTVTGSVSKLGDQFGSPTRTDLLLNFITNKLSPVASVVKDVYTGKTFQGDRPTVGGELLNLFSPLPITNYQELAKDPNSANKVLALIADGLGMATNTYGGKDTITSKKVYDAASGGDIGNNYALIQSFVRAGATKADVNKLLDTYYKENPTKSKQAEQDRKVQKDSLNKLFDLYSKPRVIEYDPGDAKDAPRDFWGRLGMFSKAIKVDPRSAVEAALTPERMRKITGDALIFQRQNLSFLDNGNKDTQVDHVIALALGGSNDVAGNTQAYATADNALKGQLETYLMKLLADGKIKKKQAQAIDKKWQDYVDKKDRKVLKELVNQQSSN